MGKKLLIIETIKTHKLKTSVKIFLDT